MRSTGIIYRYQAPKKIRKPSHLRFKIGFALFAISLGGIFGPFLPSIRLESGYFTNLINNKVKLAVDPPIQLPPAAPVIFNPLATDDGASIDPINTDFSLIVPKVGINATVIPSVNPIDPGKYLEALKTGVAHASTSFFPDEDGTVYLFSHSTNYDWFVRDINAVFYLLKNLKEGDLMVIFYQDKRYTYRLRETRVVKPSEVSYLVPQSGKKTLILQTCWPPGSVTERLLLFADLVEEQGQTI